LVQPVIGESSVRQRSTLSDIISQLGTRLNQVTGYDEVVQLKRKVGDSGKLQEK
jgi:hypothetical protein